MSAFPPASPEAWSALVAKTLKGGSIDDLTHVAPGDLAARALYTAAEAVEPVAVARAPSLVDRPWDVRTPCDAHTAAAANAAILADLEGGAASVLLALDPSGARGLKAPDSADLADALAGVALELAPVALDAGFDGPQAADRLAVVAKGSPQALLAFHLDPLTAFAQAGASPAAMDEHLLTAANTAARHAPAFPRASLFLATGRAAHEAGGSDAQELGFAAACAVAYLRAMEAAGLSLQQAFDGLVWGVALDAEYFAGIAKLRALRLIAGRLARACGVTTTTRVEARSSRRMLAAKDPWTNMLRLTAAGFAGAVGGADAVVLDPFTQAVGRSTPFARRQARNTQLILMEEAHLGRVEDPARGAWALDAHARARAEAAGLQFQAIEAEGGVLAALRAGAFADQVAAVRVQRDADLAEGRAQIVGVTKFADPEPRPASVQPWPPRPVPDWSGDACAPLAPISLTAAFEAAQ